MCTYLASPKGTQTQHLCCARGTKGVTNLRFVRNRRGRVRTWLPHWCGTGHALTFGATCNPSRARTWRSKHNTFGDPHKSFPDCTHLRCHVHGRDFCARGTEGECNRRDARTRNTEGVVFASPSTCAPKVREGETNRSCAPVHVRATPKVLGEWRPLRLHVRARRR